MLQDYEQWRSDTGSTSRVHYAQERGIELQYLTNCLKWHYEACKRGAERGPVTNADNKPNDFPSLVAVTKKDVQTKPLPDTQSDSAIRIRMRASNIDIAGDIAPTLLAQLLSTLGALNVL
jgi:hypothetical protein